MEKLYKVMEYKNIHPKRSCCYEQPKSNLTDIIVTISSVNYITLSKHQVGNVLDIVLGKNESLFLEDEDGELLGAIRPDTSKILHGIKNGATYEAEILAINTPACVQIRRKLC